MYFPKKYWEEIVIPVDQVEFSNDGALDLVINNDIFEVKNNAIFVDFKKKETPTIVKILPHMLLWLLAIMRKVLLFFLSWISSFLIGSKHFLNL